MVPAPITEADFDAQLEPSESPAPDEVSATPEPVLEAAETSESEASSPESEAGRTLANARKAKDPEKRKQSIQNEINQLVKQRETERGLSVRERSDLQSEIAALRAERDSLKPTKAEPASPQGDPEPTEDQFETYGAYVKAQARWEARQEIQAARAEDAKQSQQQTHQRVQSERMGAYVERLEKNRADDPELDDVIASAPDLRFTRPMQDALFDADHPGALMKYLIQHEDDYRRIYALQRPLLAYREMSKLEARLDAAAPGPAPVVKMSQAKPPLKPVGSAPSTGDSDEATEDLPIEEFIARGNRADRKRSASR